MTTISRRARLADILGGVRRARALGRHDTWTRSDLLAWQWRQLDELHAFARERSRFYRDRPPGATLDKATLMERFDDVVTDPRLTLAALEAHVDGLTGDELLNGEYRVMATGGTSGRRAVLPYSRAEWRAAMACFVRWSDLTSRRPSPGRRIATVMARHPQHMTVRYANTLDVGLMRLLRLDAGRPVRELAVALQAHRPQEISGYPSVLALLAVEQLEGRLDIAPTFVATTSEVRTPEMARLIIEAWGVAPNDCYGITEAGISAVDCTHRDGLHVLEDHVMVEILDDDGRPVPDGELGRLVVTPLHLRTLPLLRYEMGDLVRATTEPCACGRPYLRLVEIQGRSDDVLRLPSGVTLHPIVLRSPMAAVPGLVRYQVVSAEDGLTVRMVLRDGVEVEAARRDAERRLTAALAEAGAATAVRCEPVEDLPRSAAGKHQLVVKA